MRMARWLVIAGLVTALCVMAPEARAETCEYDTQWGVLTITFNKMTWNLSGHYPYRGGRIQGSYTPDGTMRGEWRQTDGGGNFLFYGTPGGFNGNWNYHGDGSWRGSWNGALRGCY